MTSTAPRERAAISKKQSLTLISARLTFTLLTQISRYAFWIGPA
jgi:hypothetical protein